jgi:hypothetical protein
MVLEMSGPALHQNTSSLLTIRENAGSWFTSELLPHAVNWPSMSKKMRPMRRIQGLLLVQIDKRSRRPLS